MMEMNSSKAWFVWSCAALFYLYQFIIRVSPNVIIQELMQEFAIDAATVGTLASFYYYAYAGLQVPVGVLLDRFGPRRILSIACLICGLGTILFAQAETLFWAKMGRFLIGMGSACAFAGTLKINTTWFSPKRLSLLTGLTTTLGTTGGISAGIPLVLSIGYIGWRHTLMGTAFIGIILGVIIAIFMQDQQKPLKSSSATMGGEGLLEGLKILIKMPQIWILAFYGFCLYTPFSAFADVWGTSYLMKLYSIPRLNASGMSSTIYIGAAIGGIVSAFLSEWTGRRKVPIVLGALGTSICFLFLIFYPPQSTVWATALLFTIGLFCSFHYMGFASTCELTEKSMNATAVSFVNMFTMASGVLFQPLIGGLMDRQWNGEIIDGERFYSLADYRWAITAIPVALIIGLVFACFIKETGPYKNKAN